MASNMTSFSRECNFTGEIKTDYMNGSISQACDMTGEIVIESDISGSISQDGDLDGTIIIEHHGNGSEGRPATSLLNDLRKKRSQEENISEARRETEGHKRSTKEKERCAVGKSRQQRYTDYVREEHKVAIEKSPARVKPRVDQRSVDKSTSMHEEERKWGMHQMYSAGRLTTDEENLRKEKTTGNGRSPVEHEKYFDNEEKATTTKIQLFEEHIDLDPVNCPKMSDNISIARAKRRIQKTTERASSAPLIRKELEEGHSQTTFDRRPEILRILDKDKVNPKSPKITERDESRNLSGGYAVERPHQRTVERVESAKVGGEKVYMRNQQTSNQRDKREEQNHGKLVSRTQSKQITDTSEEEHLRRQTLHSSAGKNLTHVRYHKNIYRTQKSHKDTCTTNTNDESKREKNFEEDFKEKARLGTAIKKSTQTECGAQRTHTRHTGGHHHYNSGSDHASQPKITPPSKRHLHVHEQLEYTLTEFPCIEERIAMFRNLKL